MEGATSSASRSELSSLSSSLPLPFSETAPPEFGSDFEEGFVFGVVEGEFVPCSCLDNDDRVLGVAIAVVPRRVDVRVEGLLMFMLSSFVGPSEEDLLLLLLLTALMVMWWVVGGGWWVVIVDELLENN